MAKIVELNRQPDLRLLDNDDLCRKATRELEAIGEALIKQQDKQKHARPIGNKRDVRVVTLPQPVAHLACLGLLDAIEDSYIGDWKKGEVLLIYAEENTSETEERLKNDHELYTKFYNALMFGNYPQIVAIDAYIGFIKLGNKATKKNHKRYVEIVGAELMDEPFDEMPADIASCKTHVAEFRDITLEDGVVKIPLSEATWEEMESEKFLVFLWEKKFDGLIFFPESYDYLFYTDKAQKRFIIRTSLDDEGNEEAENAVYRGTTNDKKAWLCFDLSKMEEK